jgi:hypothetical protein
MNMTTKIAAALLALVLFGSFTTFVWPTRWRYDHMTVDGDTYPVRIDRITGDAWVLLPGDGWTPDEDVTDQPQDDTQQQPLRRS